MNATTDTNAAPIFAFVDSDGKAHRAANSDDAMQRLARASFQGKILTGAEARDALGYSAVGEKPSEQQHVDLADALGVELPATWFPHGTTMLDIGRRTFRAYARKHDDLPAAADAYVEVADAIESEKRTAIETTLADVRMGVGAHGETLLVRTSAKRSGVPVSEHGLRQLLSRAGVGRATWAVLHTMDTQQRAEWWNESVTGKRGEFRIDTDKTANVLVRRGPSGDHHCYGVVGPQYDVKAAPADLLLRAYARRFESLSRADGQPVKGTVTYDPASTDVRATFSLHAPQTLDPKVGDVFRLGGGWSTNDSGSGTYSVWNEIVRIICVNCTIMNARSADSRVSHRGSFRDRMIEQLAAHLDTIEHAGADFLSAWGYARTAPVEDIEATLDAVAKRIGKLDGVNADVRKSVRSALGDAFAVEPGETGADIVNAVTRAAHEPQRFAGLLDSIAQWEIERFSMDLTREYAVVGERALRG